jgi:hypothetical protein
MLVKEWDIVWQKVRRIRTIRRDGSDIVGTLGFKMQKNGLSSILVFAVESYNV